MDDKIYIKEPVLERFEVYKINFEKVKTLDDVKSILEKIDIKIVGRENIEGVEHLVEKIRG